MITMIHIPEMMRVGYNRFVHNISYTKLQLGLKFPMNDGMNRLHLHFIFYPLLLFGEILY